jgi:tetratricopeptide (TPR) repeat protein
MDRAFAILFQELLTQFSKDEKWNDNTSIKKAITIGHAILNDEIVSEKLIKLAIISVENENHDKDDELIILLLAILYSELEGAVQQSLECFERLSQLSDEPIQKQIASFLSFVRIMELNDFNNLLKDGLNILDYYKEKSRFALWQLSNQVSVKEHTETFLAFIHKARATAGQRLSLFEGWFYSEIVDYSKALACYLMAEDQLCNEMEADELADLWSSIAICYMHLSTPDPENALMAINKALQFDCLLDEFQNEITYLATRAQIYLMVDKEKDKNKEKALADLNRVIEYNPDHEKAIDLLQKVNQGQVL